MFKFSVLSTFILTFCLGVSAQYKEEDLSLSIREINEKYYKGTNFYVGVAPGSSYLSPANKEKLAFVTDEFKYITSSAFKQTYVYPEPNAPWNDKEYKEWIELARKNGMVIRAHGPVSPQVSQWAKGLDHTAEEMLSVMTTFMTRQAKDIQANRDVVLWMDVVNETVATSEMEGARYKRGEWFGPMEKNVFWQNPWLIIGIDEKSGIPIYILKAFELANKYAPDVKKVLNNQRDPSDDLVWDKLKYTIKYLRSIGERVDGIGWQAHVSLGWENDPEKVEGLKRQIEWAHANNLEFHITELDVICPVDKWKTDRQAQAKTIGTICDIAMSYVGKGMATINFWDIIDGSRNLSGNNNKYFGGIFPDHDIEKHRNDPVYLAIKRAMLKHAPSLSTQSVKR
ncbi:MAG: endo-1,4-beta-xylanase [Porphyromonadaceae bacterium]|nr:endo-1,4-beta-xylanase [Porphyromonadaceae bacterium]